MSVTDGQRADGQRADETRADETRADETRADETRADETRADRAVDADALLPRLRVIENQPLEARAEAYAREHERLQRDLEGGDGDRG